MPLDQYNDLTPNREKAFRMMMSAADTVTALLSMHHPECEVTRIKEADCAYIVEIRDSENGVHYYVR